MNESSDLPDPSLKAWLVYAVSSALALIVLTLVLNLTLMRLWTMLDVERGRAAQGTGLLVFLASLPVSFWIFRSTVRRYFVPRPAAETER